MRLTRRSMFALALCAWFAATLFLLGDLGQWNDDYAYDLRVPETGAIDLPSISAMTRSFFFRPLFYILTTTLETTFGGHPQILHILNALAHGLVCWLLFKLLRSMGCGAVAAWLPTLVFMTYPAGWQVPFWPAALATALAMATWLALAWLALRFVRGETGLWMLLPIALVAFITPCLNEQPATGVPAMMLFAWMARRTRLSAEFDASIHPLTAVSPARRISVWPERKPFIRASLATTVSGIAVALYVALYVLTAPRGERGSMGSFIDGPQSAWHKLITTAERAWDHLLLRDFASGALRVGLEALISPQAWPLAIVLAVGIAIVVRESRRSHASPHEQTQHGTAGTLSADKPTDSAGSMPIILFGLAVFLLGWIPSFIIKQQGVESRLCYPPLLGLACMLAGTIDTLARRPYQWPRFGPWLHHGLVAACVVSTFLGTIMMIGVQAGMRERWHKDLAEAAQFRAILPNPASGTIFVPLRINNTFAEAGPKRFKRAFFGPFERPWSGTPYIRRAYARSNVSATWWHWAYGWAPVIGAAQAGLIYDDDLLHPVERLRDGASGRTFGPRVLPWAIAVPFIIDARGQVRLVRSITMQSADGTSHTFEPPQVQARLREQQSLTPATFDIVYRPDRAHPWNYELLADRP